MPRKFLLKVGEQIKIYSNLLERWILADIVNIVWKNTKGETMYFIEPPKGIKEEELLVELKFNNGGSQRARIPDLREALKRQASNN